MRLKAGIESKMHKSVDALKVELAAIRTGQSYSVSAGQDYRRILRCAHTDSSSSQRFCTGSPDAGD
jgi:hypothetical protein